MAECRTCSKPMAPIHTERRDILRERNKISSDRSQREIKEGSKGRCHFSCCDTLAEGGQCLIFESSRKNTEGMAQRRNCYIIQMIYGEMKEKLKAIADEVRETSEVILHENLPFCIEKGSAFHHAGLISEQRKLIEGGFRDGIIKVITRNANPGCRLNLPARRVIIKGYRRYDSNFGLTPNPGARVQADGRKGGGVRALILTASQSLSQDI